VQLQLSLARRRVVVEKVGLRCKRTAGLNLVSCRRSSLKQKQFHRHLVLVLVCIRSIACTSLGLHVYIYSAQVLYSTSTPTILHPDLSASQSHECSSLTEPMEAPSRESISSCLILYIICFCFCTAAPCAPYRMANSGSPCSFSFLIQLVSLYADFLHSRDTYDHVFRTQSF
jgi:hypothetical protein